MTFLFLVASLGCGGKGKLNPDDLVVYVSAALKAPRENVTVSTTFRTAIAVDVSRLNVEEAREAERQLIAACVEYFQRDGISDFLNDTLAFVIRLGAEPDQAIKWTAIAEDMRDVARGEMPLEQFFERCSTEETWSMEL